MSDPYRMRRGKSLGVYVEKSTGAMFVAQQIVVDGVACWQIDDLIERHEIISSDDFAEQFATPR